MTETVARPDRPLRHRNYRWLVGGTTTSALGNAITPIALAFAVLDLGGSASELGLVVAAFALAEVATVLFGGVLGDRIPRQLMPRGSRRGRGRRRTARCCGAPSALLLFGPGARHSSLRPRLRAPVHLLGTPIAPRGS